MTDCQGYQALPGLHAFTGCESTSAFFGQGKTTALNLVEEGIWYAMQQLGCQPTVTSELLHMCEEFTCKMYSKKVTASRVNDLWYKFWVQNPSTESILLPPTLDALSHHAKRGNYQALFVLMVHLAAPAALLELTCCGCTTGCESKHCSCQKSSLPCTDACSCTDCNSSEPSQSFNERMDNDDSDACEVDNGSQCHSDSDNCS